MIINISVTQLARVSLSSCKHARKNDLVLGTKHCGLRHVVYCSYKCVITIQPRGLACPCTDSIVSNKLKNRLYELLWFTDIKIYLIPEKDGVILPRR